MNDDQNPTLFESGEPHPLESLPERIRTMYERYGKTGGCACGQCKNLVRNFYRSTSYFKCNLTRQSHGPGTDWRIRWTACGKFEFK